MNLKHDCRKSENLLSQVHIQKLGHPLEEIRVRALSSVISKFNLNLVNENDAQIIETLLKKLVEWFKFEKCPEQKKVISLFLRVVKCEAAKIIIRQMGKSNFFKNLEYINKHTMQKYSSLLDEVRLAVENFDNNIEDYSAASNEIHYLAERLPQLNLNNNNNNTHHNYFKCKHEIEGEYNCKAEKTAESGLMSKKCDIPIQKEEEFKIKGILKNGFYSQENIKNDNCIVGSCFKIELFPWQNLVSNDKQVLTSVFDGLKYVDDKSSVLQSCQFFSEVVLRDFPPEIFIQRPLILRTFLQMLDSACVDVQVPVIKCLIKIVQFLKMKIHLTLSQSVFNKKKEFYTTFVYPDETLNGDSKEHFYSNFTFLLEEDITLNDKTNDDSQKLKKYQLYLPEFCFEVLIKVLSHLQKKHTLEESNYLFELTHECLNCLLTNLKPDFWQSAKSTKDKFYQIFSLIQEVMNYYKHHNPIAYVTLLSFIIKTLNFLKPSSGLDLTEVLPNPLQLELSQCIFTSFIYFMFPQLHSDVFKYVKQFLGQREKKICQDYDDIRSILNSMKSCAMFLKNRSILKTTREILDSANESLASLHFNESYQFVHSFLTGCLLKWRKPHLSESEANMRKKIFLTLLSHSNSNIRMFIYRDINDQAVRLLGNEEAKQPNYEFPGDNMDFMFYSDIFEEIICYGLNSDMLKIREYSSNILVHFLRSKFLMSEPYWSDFMSALVPCFPLLECHANKSTLLGRCVIKMFDPDVAMSSDLPPLELIKGNIRLLFSKNSLAREEAVSRLLWLLNQDDSRGEKLPKVNVLASLNLSGICASVKPREHSFFQQSFYDPGKLCDVVEMIASKDLEPNVRKSALSQLSVMMEDVLLHATFLEQKGLEIILHLLEKSLLEGDYRYSPDSVVPIVDVLKQVAFHNASACLELSLQTKVFYNVLRSLFLFSSDERLRRNAVELLFLLLYGDFTLRVPSDKSSRRLLSFPNLIVTHMIVPFESHVHWKKSRHTDFNVKRTLLAKQNFPKLIQINWAIQWIASLPELLIMSEADLREKMHSSGIPDDLKINYEDLNELRKCAFGSSIKYLLCDVQNASTHETVCLSIQKLRGYLLLHKVGKELNVKIGTDIANENILSHMLWESTLEKFMVSTPTCTKDESLLLLVVQFIQNLFSSFKSDRLLSWIEKILTDVHKPLYKTLKLSENNHSGLKKRELRLSVLELIQQVITARGSIDSVKWFPYLLLISDLLKLDKKTNEFYNAAYVDWLISVLADLTRKCSFANKSEHLENIIMRIMEIIIAFHCTQDSSVSFMGLNIVKNSLFVLNHILHDTQNNLEGWEDIWYRSLSKVTGRKENINYCWLMSLWFTRDPILRAASFQLFVGFSITVKGCQLLLDRMKISFKHIWSEGFKILFDENECCCVREKCCLMLSNLIGHGNKIYGSFFDQLKCNNFYEKLLEIVESYRPSFNYSELILDTTMNIFKGEVAAEPGFITAISALMLNVVAIEPVQESEKIVESGLLESLTRVLGEVPDSAVVCEDHLLCLDTLEMYIQVCRLLKKCATFNSAARSFLLQSHSTIANVFNTIDYTHYCNNSKTLVTLRNNLWMEAFDFFSALLMNEPKNCGQGDEHSAFFAFNRCMTENGVDQFTSSLHIALTSDMPALRTSAQQFLINIFHHEMLMRSYKSVADIFEREISEEALQLSRQFGSREIDVPKNLRGKFGVRLADVFLQTFILSFEDEVPEAAKARAANALAGLFAVYRPSQNFCTKNNLGGFIVLHLKKICVKLSLENTRTFKKLSEKKRVEPLFKDMDILYQLISNFSYENENSKTDLANLGLPVIVHKLWPWSALKPSLLATTLKMLCTFTHSFNRGCRSLVQSSNFPVVNLNKLPGSMTLMNSIIGQITIEMDSVSKTNQESQILQLCLQTLTNCCDVIECRSVISKGNIFQCLIKLQGSRKKRSHGEDIVDAWLKFLVAFSSYQEGQIALTKIQEVLDLILSLATTALKFNQRMDAFVVLRNICFHQVNKYRMLSWCEFLTLLQDALTSGRHTEVEHAANTIWTLACNSQKSKSILRSAGFEGKLEAAKRQAIAGDDQEILNLVANVLTVLEKK